MPQSVKKLKKQVIHCKKIFIKCLIKNIQNIKNYGSITGYQPNYKDRRCRETFHKNKEKKKIASKHGERIHNIKSLVILLDLKTINAQSIHITKTTWQN